MLLTYDITQKSTQQVRNLMLFPRSAVIAARENSQSSTPSLAFVMIARVYSLMPTASVVIVNKVECSAMFSDIWSYGSIKLGSTPGGGGIPPTSHCEVMIALDLATFRVESSFEVLGFGH